MMTLLWTMAAMAASPEALAEAAGPAAEQLAACADEGCGPEDGAKAAFLVALHTYQSEGVADGELAAAVRYLDPALFEDLPDVLRTAATRPPAWATRTLSPMERMPAALFEGPEPPPYTFQQGVPTSTLMVTVEDVRGEVVPTAVVRFAAEQPVRHRVYSETGTWMGTVLYLRDGSEKVFQRGAMVDIEVTAPGFRPQRLTYLFPRRKKAAVVVQLKPLEARPDGTEAGKAAWAAHQAWAEAETEHLTAPSEETQEARELARLEGAVLARAWMDAGGGDDALELCRLMGSIPYCAAE